MLLLISNKLCSSSDSLTKAAHFTNLLPTPLKNDYSKLNLRVEGIEVHPWPKKPFLVLCNLCDKSQLAGGQQFTNVLTMCGTNKFTKPRVPMQPGSFEQVEVKLEHIDGENVAADIVMLQICID